MKDHECEEKKLKRIDNKLKNTIDRYLISLGLQVDVHIESLLWDIDNNNTIGSTFLKSIINIVGIGPRFYSLEYVNRCLDQANILFRRIMEDSQFEVVPYINHIDADKSRKYIFFIGLRIIEKDVKDIFLNKPTYSFIKYIMDTLFKLYRSRNEKDILRKLAHNVNGKAISTHILSLGNNFLDVLISDFYNLHNRKLDLFEDFEAISKMEYEGKELFATILLFNDKIIEEEIKFLIRFREPVEYRDHRNIRKLLEMAGQDIYLIGGEKGAYGLTSFQHIQNLLPINQTVLGVEFIDYFEYRLSLVTINIKEQTIGKKTILNIQDGVLRFSKGDYFTEELKKSLENTFQTCFQDSKGREALGKLIDIVTHAVKQEHGTMLVIGKPEDAKEEVNRLRKESLRIEEVDLHSQINISKELIQNITNIDGALYLDVDGKCHALGVILDGVADTNGGDPARGARYNSAVRYVASMKNKEKECLAVIISEDGMVNIKSSHPIDPIDKEEKFKLKDLETNLINLMVESKNFDRLDAFINCIGYKDIKMKKPTVSHNDLAESYCLQGRACMLSNRYYNALYFYNKAIDTKEDYIPAYRGRGITYCYMYNYSQAINDFTYVLSRCEDKKSYYNRANAHMLIEDYQMAINDYNQAIRLDERYDLAYMGRAAVFYNQGNYYMSAENYKIAKELLLPLKSQCTDQDNLVRYENLIRQCDVKLEELRKME
ncbi:tetratricopeptide repeat protein [Ectobacillus funiculus]|uniref:tetratricopeptide repeat protein n=1 Tax=Ectobacillus funiculus TaxID=137993 RepID=UPI00101C7984|nr:tetratricopeptide repeat protein [Ectobacillus funiculus]